MCDDSGWRGWSREAFVASLARYWVFCEWLKTKGWQAKDLKAAVEAYTPDTEKRLEIQVIFSVKEMSIAQGFELTSVKSIRMSPDGELDVDVAR